jgi:transposase InsO family protein
MTREEREKVAAFRFSVIYPLLDLSREKWGVQKKILEELSDKEWRIPFSPRTRISKATILSWLSRYEKSGRQIESLHPKSRGDIGGCRIMDGETELAFINLRKQFMKASVPVLLKLAKERNILPPDFKASSQSIYRLLKKHGLDRDRKKQENMLKFEVELPNDMWQSDCMHGPSVIHDGRMKKTYMFAIIDDHSRLITHAQFYLRENIESFLDCFKKALVKRGLPRKLYTDNGAYFKSHKLQYGCASLGIALSYARPYRPQGKGKIERFNRTVRTEPLAILPEHLTLEKLNKLLADFLDEYHNRKHSSTGKPPLERYLGAVSLLRSAPENLNDYFRKRIRRTVSNDRAVSIENRLYEAPIGLAGQKVMLLYNEADLGRVEVFIGDKSMGFLKPLDLNANSRVRRSSEKENTTAYTSGSVFG